MRKWKSLKRERNARRYSSQFHNCGIIDEYFRFYDVILLCFISRKTINFTASRNSREIFSTIKDKTFQLNGNRISNKMCHKLIFYLKYLRLWWKSEIRDINKLSFLKVYSVRGSKRGRMTWANITMLQNMYIIRLYLNSTPISKKMCKSAHKCSNQLFLVLTNNN